MITSVPEQCLWVWALLVVLNDKQTATPQIPTDSSFLFAHSNDDLDKLAQLICQVKLFEQAVVRAEWDALCYLFLRRIKERFPNLVPPGQK